MAVGSNYSYNDSSYIRLSGPALHHTALHCTPLHSLLQLPAAAHIAVRQLAGALLASINHEASLPLSAVASMSLCTALASCSTYRTCVDKMHQLHLPYALQQASYSGYLGAST